MELGRGRREVRFGAVEVRRGSRVGWGVEVWEGGGAGAGAGADIIMYGWIE